MENSIKNKVLDTIDICEHKKDCCHPHCDCGLSPGCSNVKIAADFSSCKNLPSIRHIPDWDIGMYDYGPLKRYERLISIRNRKVEQGIPLH